MSSKRESVSIDLRNLDGISIVAKGQAAEDLLKNHHTAMTAKDRWNMLFPFACLFAILFDPLLLYIPFIYEELMCLKYDYTLFGIYCAVRTACDVFYIIDIIISLPRICKKRKGSMFSTCWKNPGSERKGARPLKEEKSMKRWLLPFCHLLVSLPLPAVLVGILLRTRVDFDPFWVIVLIISFQYVLRVFMFYGSRRWRPIKTTKVTAWLMDFSPFVLASHLFGGLWYWLAVRRVVSCWWPHYKKLKGSPFLYYDSSCFNIVINSTRLQELCPTKIVDVKILDMGIYSYAIQSNVIGTTFSVRKIMVSFWWGLRNLSSFGSNLSTSTHPFEIIFSVVISICGMALFLVYLNARVQESQRRSNEHNEEKKNQLMIPYIDLWLTKNSLSNLNKRTNDLKIATKKKTLKSVIIKNIHKLEENREIDLQSIISVLPIKFRKDIANLLCLASLFKVPKLATLSAKMLQVICEHLKPVIYNADTCIIREGKPLGMMVFITQGLVWSYTRTNIYGDSTRNDEWLKQGDFYGDELLNWAFKSPLFSVLPFSTRTVVAQEKVEAFVIRASDLKSIVCKFWWHFTKELEPVDLKQWEISAACSIQATWRNQLARNRRANRWDKFIAQY